MLNCCGLKNKYKKIVKYSNNHYYHLLYKYNKYSKIEKNEILNKAVVVKNINFHEKIENLLCVTTFRLYNRKTELIRFIDHYLNLGINLFVIYKSSCSKEVDFALKKYEKSGIVVIISENYSFKSNIFKYGNYLHVWKHNDCFLRYKYYANHILFVDQDELLITTNLHYPKNNDVYFFYSLLNISNGKYNNYSFCPKSPWKYFIYNTECVEYIDIHDVIIKQHCKIKVLDSKDSYILHNRVSYPWYYKQCRFNLNTIKFINR